MVQQGQTFELERRGRDGERLWAYRYRMGGRDSQRVQRGGFGSAEAAREALERELERLRREQRIVRGVTLAELVETYLGQHDVQPVTIEKLSYLLGKATAVFGDRKIAELTSQEIAEWRMGLSPGYRFEATQALRQVLHRAVAWGMIDVNPAKVGVDNPARRRKEQRPFESWAELEALAAAIGPRYGPMVIFAAATGLRPAEWIALEKRDVDRKERVVYIRRSFTRGELKFPKTEASMRAVPLQGERPKVCVCGLAVSCESVLEVGVEGGEAFVPARHGAFPCGLVISDREVDELAGGLVVGEVTADPDRFADDAVEALDLVGRVDRPT